jgi:argininosuccinate lyase
VVRHAEAQGCDLAEIKLPELRRYSRLIEADVYATLSLEGSLRSRRHRGGTAPAQVRAAIARARRALR